MKQWYQSKTIWVNVVTALVAVLTTLKGTDLIIANPQVVVAFGAVIAVTNVILRLITKEPIGAK